VRRSAALIAGAAAALGAGPAQAAAPASQRAALDDGTAILQVRDGAVRAKVRTALAARGLKAQAMKALPMVVVRGSATALRAAARSPEVVAAHPDRRLAFELWQGTPVVFGGRQAELAALGYDGRGLSIAIVDSGVDGLHRDLADHMVANHKVLESAGVATVQGCPPGPPTCDWDDNGHGSHVAGIAAGDGTESAGFYTGIAPGAGVVGYSVGFGPSILFPVVAYDHILANPQLAVRVVNSSFGVTGGGRFDSTDPINQATKRLHAAGITVVFSNGNSGTNAAGTPPGASDCSTSGAGDACKTNPYSVAPWVLSAAGGRKDVDGPRSAQPLSFYSARGDPDPQVAPSGETIDYSPTLTAPGTNVRSVLDPTATPNAALTFANDPSAATPPPGKESLEAFYTPLTGTSMAAPALTGAVAVMQSAAKARLGRFLTPAEVEGIVTRNADAMTPVDALYDFPCGTPGTDCGTAPDGLGLTGQPLEKWQNGAGYLDIPGAVAEVEAIPRPAGTGNPSTGVSASCVDRIAPRAGLRYSGLKLRSRRRLTVSGRAGDTGCAGLRSVRVAVARRAGRRCRFANPAGRLGRVRACGYPRRYLPTAGGSSWSLALARSVKPGRYLVWARAADTKGNASRPGPARALRVR
jgi:subtilisin family serine protease